jgi:hypothetical protein
MSESHSVGSELCLPLLPPIWGCCLRGVLVCCLGVMVLCGASLSLSGWSVNSWSHVFLSPLLEAQLCPL